MNNDLVKRLGKINSAIMECDRVMQRNSIHSLASKIMHNRKIRLRRIGNRLIARMGILGTI